MDEAKNKLVRRWLVKAQHDLASAKKLSEQPDSYLDTAVFHCQQAAEKAVKDFLVFRDIKFSKTHDMGILIASAGSVEKGFPAWYDAGQRLTPYAGASRYPSEVEEPYRDEFNEALKAASGIFSFVLSVLPNEVHPK